MAYKEDWVIVNQIPSRVKTWGGWIEDPAGDSIVIFIPGNPGISSFYDKFLASLHQQLSIPVWTMSHAGHEVTKLKYPSEPSLYNVAGQVAHKMAFIKQYVPANQKIYLIGHSMGAKIITELLKDKQIADHTEKCYLLMPTLERIAETPNGQFARKVLRFMSAIIFFSSVICCLPEKCLKYLINCWFMLSRYHAGDKNSVDSAYQLLQPKILRNVFNLLLDEFEHIKELDLKVVDTQCSKLKLYFSQNDSWAPLSYMDSLKKVKPEIDATVLGKQFYHAFILDCPEEMADILVNEIKQIRSTH